MTIYVTATGQATTSAPTAALCGHLRQKRVSLAGPKRSPRNPITTAAEVR